MTRSLAEDDVELEGAVIRGSASPVMPPENGIPTHPGEILLEESLRPLGLTQVALARHLGIWVGSATAWWPWDDTSRPGPRTWNASRIPFRLPRDTSRKP